MRDSWEEKMISEFADVVSGGTPSTQIESFWNGDINWITPTDLSKLNYPKIENSIKKITKLGLRNSSANLIPAESIVMSSRAPIGYFAVPSTQYTTNQGCKSIVVCNGQNVIFHYYNFLFNVFTFKNRGEGTTFAEISKKAIEILKFKIPPLPQQKKIAQILSTCDAVLEKTEAAIAKYQALKQGLMHDLFTRGIDIDTGRLRPSYNEAPELYKETVLGFVPREWEVKELANITSYVDYRGKTPPKADKGIFLITAKNIKFGYIDYEISKEYIKASSYANAMSRGKPKAGDVLITTEAPMGNVAQVDNPEFALAQRVIKYRCSENIMSNDFLKYFLMSNVFQRELNAESTGSTVKGIKGSRLHKLKVFQPGLKEQKTLVLKLKSIDQKIHYEQQTLEKYQKLKAGLMQDLLSGKVGVEGLLDNKKIRA